MPERKELPRPTEAELAILRVLWRRGATTVREVHRELSARKETGYTTVLKLMQIMTDKGLVERDERERAHVYRACAAEAAVQQELVDDLMDRVFGGSAERLVQSALASKPTSAEELARIRALLDQIERRKR